MHAESSDGFASVGTILPKGKAALLPGGFFAFERGFLGLCEVGMEVTRRDLNLNELKDDSDGERGACR